MIDGLRLLGFGEGGWGMALLTATGVTALLSIVGFAAGVLCGGAAAAARLSSVAALRFIANAYGTVFRGVPDLLTIYLLYYGGSIVLTASDHALGGVGFVGLPTFAAGVVAIGIICGAYQSEVYRGAYLAIDPGQTDAGRALGLSRWQRLRLVMLPQLLRHALPGLGNVWQLVLKDSALISVIGLVELMRQAQIASGSTREPFLFYTAAALLYFAVAVITGQAFRLAEIRVWRGARGV
jgi:octopine/nopaline transport system permease protein